MNFFKVTKYYQEIQIEWQIHDIFTSRNNSCFVSDIFTFAGTSWRLLLDSRLSEEPESARFTFMFIEPCDHPVKYKFSLKNPDGNLEHLACGFMKKQQKVYKNHYIKLKQMLQQRPEYASSKFISILGSLKTVHCHESNEPSCKKLKRLDTLSENFHCLYTDQLSCDTILHVEDKKFSVHKAVLIARSKVFAAMFQHETSEKQSGIIKITDCNSESFEKFLKFLYCGKLEDITCSSAFNLYVTSEKYNVQDLKTFCREHLMENLELDIWCDVYAMAHLYDDEKLLFAAQVFFNKNFLQIFKTPEWEHFMKDNHQLACKLLKLIPEDKTSK